MSNFINLKSTKINKQALFGEVSLNSINIFETSSGENVGFKIVDLGKDENNKNYYVSEIYKIDDIDTVVGSVSVSPGIDLTGGLFSTGCASDRDPLDKDAKFYLFDY